MNTKLEAFKKYINGKKVAVMGVGISNRPLIRYIHSLGANITAFDALPKDDIVLSRTISDFEADGININWSCGSNYLDLLTTEKFDLIFRTPRMRNDVPELVTAISNGAKLTSEMEVFMELCPAKIFAVTGSDGKTTTTTLIYEMLKTTGHKVYVGGNIGTPLLDKSDEISSDDYVVLELSSFQLLTMSISADISVVTNITPNHLDVHKDYQEYIDVKTNIFRHERNTKVVLNSSNEITYNMRSLAHGDVMLFAQEERQDSNDMAFVRDGALMVKVAGKVTKICEEDEILIPGKHNVENYLAAICAVLGYVEPSNMRKVAMTFKGVEHRIELVTEYNGVKIYNSSIDTSPNRTINTMNALKLRGMKGVLIAGGADKNCIYTGLGDAILNVCDKVIICDAKHEKSNTKQIIDILASEANGREYLCETISEYDDAIKRAIELANEGEIIILSPVGTSYDRFRHFEERGRLFKDLVLDITSK